MLFQVVLILGKLFKLKEAIIGLGPIIHNVGTIIWKILKERWGMN